MIVRRKIAELKWYRVRCKVGAGSFIVTFSCGHTDGYKQSELKSKGYGDSIKCRRCTSGEMPDIEKVKDIVRSSTQKRDWSMQGEGIAILEAFWKDDRAAKTFYTEIEQMPLDSAAEPAA